MNWSRTQRRPTFLAPQRVAHILTALKSNGSASCKIGFDQGPVLQLTLTKGPIGGYRDVQFMGEPAPCPHCQRRLQERFREMNYASHASDMEFFLRWAWDTVAHHGCLQTSRSTPREETDRAPQQPRVRPIPPEPRVKVLGPGVEPSAAAGAAVPPPGAARETEPPAPRIAVLDRAQPRREAADTLAERAYSIPEIAYELQSGSKVSVILSLNVCTALIQHCGRSNRHRKEVIGILVGYSRETESPPDRPKDYHVVVTDILPVDASDASAGHVRLDEDAWMSINQEFDRRYTPQGKVRLGWYHTHPTQGIFLSRQDVDAHTVFTNPHQFALVVDPQRMEAGLFYWDDYGTRALGGPLGFRLKREHEHERERARDQAGAVDTPERSRRGPLSWLRFTVFAAVAAMVTWVVGRQPALRALTPEQACVLALTILFGLRLWNVNVFHPQNPIELVILDDVVEFLETYETELFFLVLLVLILSIFWLILSLRFSRF